jgi:acetylornithine deacetylase/succinyl-diaminopimelate desuccinylase-like protein
MSTTSTNNRSIYKRPAELLRSLIRFDTTNPPGNETDCVRYIEKLLGEAGIESTILAKDPLRANLVARLEGAGSAPPLLLYGHLDVVTTSGQEWTHPPFEGKMSQGYVWGRGALDMKGGVAMMLSAFLRLKADGWKPAGDIVFAALSDEEAGGEYGAEYLAANHAHLFDGARYAIGEFGGFPMYFEGKKFYAVQVAEKQICWLKATVRGPGGHGSLPMRRGATAKLGDMLTKLDRSRLPVHITSVSRRMLETISAALDSSVRSPLADILDPGKTNAVLDELGQLSLMLDAMLHNTINANIVRGGEKINVVPSEIAVELDGRLLPGFRPEDLMAEVRDIVGDEIEIELIRHDPAPTEPDMGLFDTLAGILHEADPEGSAVPLLQPGSPNIRLHADEPAPGF